MTFVSYAQNFEDVLLRRALAGVERGCYVDIGAGDPVLDSVTKGFSEAGWRGVNVEPLAAAHARLLADRPRDTNLRAVVTAETGTVRLFEVEGFDALSTTVESVADEYRAVGRTVTEQLTPALTLADVFAQYVEGPVHFLKIDVEGAELDVLRGADFAAHRPWIVVVETLAFGRESADADAIDGLLEAARYRRVYFDGLNRFYLAAEHEGLAGAFDLPVNVRDDFTLALEGRAREALRRIAELLGLAEFSDEHEVVERLTALIRDRIAFETAAGAAIAERDAAAAALAELDGLRQQSFERERFIAWQAVEVQEARVRAAAAHAAADAQVERMRRSLSWRLTMPLRVLRRPGHYLKSLTSR